MENITCPKLAYIAGVYMGDGCFFDAGHRATLIFVMKDLDVLETIAGFHHEVCGRSCSPRPLPSRPHLSRLQLTNTELARGLRDLTGGKTRLPMLDGDAAKREFIAGLMDTDGHVRQGRTANDRWNRFYLCFVNSGKWLPDFLSLIEGFGAKVGKPTLKGKTRSQDEADCWQIGINLRSFVEAGLFFRCARKRAVVDAYLDCVRRQNF